MTLEDRRVFIVDAMHRLVKDAVVAAADMPDEWGEAELRRWLAERIALAAIERKVFTADEVRDLLRRACEAAGSQSAWARANGLEGPNVCAAIAGRRPFFAPMLARLGLRKIILYSLDKPAEHA
jgi:hypothetical protein